MAIAEEILSQLGCRFAVLLPHLNERQRRLAVATEARLLGHGGVRAAASIGNAIREIRPLLDQAGHVPTPASTRYRTGSDLLAAAASAHESHSLDTPTG